MDIQRSRTANIPHRKRNEAKLHFFKENTVIGIPRCFTSSARLIQVYLYAQVFFYYYKNVICSNFGEQLFCRSIVFSSVQVLFLTGNFNTVFVFVIMVWPVSIPVGPGSNTVMGPKDSTEDNSIRS